jgi:pyrroloquinoline quinone (PQQ) biosynthesis protein C
MRERHAPHSLLEEVMAVSPPQQADYLYQPSEPWVRDLVADVIQPWRERALQHPFIQATSAGEVSREALARTHGEVLWVVTSFPEVIAALASRCPKYDHEMKNKLLLNAYEEHSHPGLLANAINALGGDGDRILNDAEWTYEPSDWAWHTKAWLDTCVYHLPWNEALAGTAVGIEAIVPTIFYPILQALRTRYGLTDEELTWHEIHAGEIEQEHGNEGLRLLEKYVDSKDTALVNRCRRAVDRTMRSQGQEFLDMAWAFASSKN